MSKEQVSQFVAIFVICGSMKIRKGDNVIMLAGKDTGKKGIVERTVPSRSAVVVAGLNLVKHHRKPRKQGEKGQIVEAPRSVDVSNVALVCPACGKATRIGYVISAEGKKNRICKKCNATV